MNVNTLGLRPGLAVWPPEIPSPAAPAPGAGEAASFGDLLAAALARVEQDQLAAQQAARALAAGQVQDVSQVMIAAERASLSLALAVQVRNKALEAYQELMRMPL